MEIDNNNFVVSVSVSKSCYNSPGGGGACATATANTKPGCEECVLEKWRHNQTKKALNRAIGLSHRLMQEIRRLESHITNMEQLRRSVEKLEVECGQQKTKGKDPRKPIILDAWASE